ncbi:cell division protein FtsQ/DivIB [Limosilactobacillus fastidiosus]|nr:FtsQ-type POTRA domain-containing protein [Limosilactobacillus fastidiosus]MCD7083434.1 FtsQ-type POTRA domain-containing protein [Limosilactobacillus fastidiosus]MCD7085254.1 FtsQ-type POTRA domain-containing protein [Limosilactobacillus fastidiosus]MCD7115197.1 FtsQ-type POTRA domain-containing protein [Limosilactobacillus fastidiosus]MCD7115503.1 FtsQ-type POTRA domain-containing protein [Limosilactobacillus fastidiosus]
MTRGTSIPEHRRYSQRLAHLERQNFSAQKAHQPIGSKVVGIKQHRRNSSKKRISALMWLFGIILLVMIYIILPISKITNITISGNNELTDKEVENASTIRPGRLIWTAWLGQNHLEHEAKITNPQVKTLEVSLRGPQSVHIAITENRLLGEAQVGKQKYAVLSNGQLQLTTAQNTNIDFQGFENHRQQLEILGQQLGKLKPVIYHGISSIKYQPTKESPHQVILYMKDGNTVKATLTNVGDKMKYYPSILTKMKGQGVIDLRVGAYSYDYGEKSK